MPTVEPWMNSEEAVTRLYANHVNPTFTKLLDVLGYGRLFTRAENVWVWDSNGNKYLDALAGFGAVNIGHNHPHLVSALKDFLSNQHLNLCHIGVSAWQAKLAQSLSNLLPNPLEISLFSNGGAEAVEAGLKLARAATRRAGFIACKGGYHGTSFGSLSVTHEQRMRKPFEPLLPGCTLVPFGNIEELEKALKSKLHAAFLLEPIQGEAGAIIPPTDYLAEAARLCNKYGTLLILDEVQTGLGRTGTLFAFETSGIIPDILVLAKSLGGGIASIGATITSTKLFKRAYGSISKFDLHSSTFGGNAFACFAANETLSIISNENLAQRCKQRGEQLAENLKLKLADHPLVRSIRGKGLMLGIEIGLPNSEAVHTGSSRFLRTQLDRMTGQWMSLKLLESGIICQPASHNWNILKISPPLTISKEEIDIMANSISLVFLEQLSQTKVLKGLTSRLIQRKLLRKRQECP